MSPHLSKSKIKLLWKHWYTVEEKIGEEEEMDWLRSVVNTYSKEEKLEKKNLPLWVVVNALYEELLF